MKLKDLDSNNIKKISNQELLSLHRRVHQLWGVYHKYHIEKFKKEDYESFLRELHDSIIVPEMVNSRGLKHTSPLKNF